MVEVEFVQAIDESHQQDEPSIAFGDDGVIETWEEMKDPKQQKVNHHHESNPAIRDFHQCGELLTWCEIHQPAASYEFDAN